MKTDEKILSHDELMKKMLADPETKAAYDDLEEKYSLIRELIRARKAAGLTQAEVANRMNTKPSALSRIEAGSKHIPSIQTLRKYAAAVNCRLKISFVPAKPGGKSI